MAQVIPNSQQTIIKEIVTKEGEVTINLVLNIKLDIGNVPSQENNLNYSPDIDKKENINYYIPDFKNEPLIDFGKKVQED